MVYDSYRMGPVDKAINDSENFRFLYAVYSGVAFLTSVAIILKSGIAPLFLHQLRLDIEE